MAENNRLLNDEISLDKVAQGLNDINFDDVDKIKELTDLQAKMSDFLIDRFATNLEAFRKYIPDVAKNFEHYRPKRSMEFFCTTNGIPNLVFCDNNEIFYKVYDPFELCKKQVEEILNTSHLLQTRYDYEWDPFGQIHFKYLNKIVQISKETESQKFTPMQLGSIPNCVLIGIGLGYSLAYLYERVEIANLVIVEPNLDVFFASMHTFDWANLLQFLFENHYGINLMLGQTPVQFGQDIQNYYNKHGRFLSGSWLGIVHYVSKDIKQIADIIMRDFDSLHAAMGFYDDHLFGTCHALQAVLDGKNFVRNDVKLKPNYVNAPVFIIGSGPSLDHDIPFLRKFQDKAIIIACGTAVDTLYHAGIKPDFYANTERTAEIIQALKTVPDEHFYDDMILLAGDVIHPNTTKMFKHTAIFGKIDEPFFKYFFAMVPQFRCVDFVQLMNPLVGNMGLAGAIYLGFRNLYLFGLDNGKKVGLQNMHSKYTALYGSCGNSDTTGSYKVGKILPGNFGGEVETTYFFELSARNMGYLLENFKFDDPVDCKNCSDGIKINGSTPMHSEDLWEQFSKRADLKKEKFRDFINHEKTVNFKMTKDDIKSLFNPELFDETVDRVTKILEKKCEPRLDTILQLEEVSEILYYLQQHYSTFYYAFALEGTLQTMFIMLTRALYAQQDEKACLEVCHHMQDVVLEFLDESKVLFRYMPDYFMRDHRKYYPDGKVGKDYPITKAPNLPPLFNLKNDTSNDPQRVFEKKYEQYKKPPNGGFFIL